MKDVLLAIDDNVERALAQADTVVDLFDPEGVRAHLFHDFVDNPEGASITQVRSARRAASQLEAAGFDIEYHEASGDPSQSITQRADEIDADAICIAGRKRSPAGKALFGSVAQEVILGTDRPVLVISATDRP